MKVNGTNNIFFVLFLSVFFVSFVSFVASW
jgi:hypothetical protein